MEKDFAILVVAYKRPQALDKLLSKIALAGSFRVYIALDAPNSSSDSDLNADCVSVISKFEQDYSGQVHRKFTSKNLGCAVSVIKACNWVFEYEEFVVILEDDCHPENGFFDFVRDSRTVIENDRRVLMVCGTQFAPTEITNNVWSYSKYPLIWGWATTKPAWLTIEKLLKSENLYKSRNTTWRTSDYFFGGQGHVDHMRVSSTRGIRLLYSKCKIPTTWHCYLARTWFRILGTMLRLLIRISLHHGCISGYLRIYHPVKSR